MTDRKKTETPVARTSGDTEEPRKSERRLALWLGGGQGHLDMGWGRGPRTLQGHELISWFFSRDGH